MGRDILISEVGPRDGLQSIKSIMPLPAKKAWISALAASGLREIEVGSFVPAQVLPQLADTAEVVAHALTIPNLTVAVLVPNLRGAEAAVRAGAHKLTIPFSASETHSPRTSAVHTRRCSTRFVKSWHCSGRNRPGLVRSWKAVSPPPSAALMKATYPPTRW